MKFKVCIEETVSEIFEVEAKDGGEALEIAEKEYFEGKLVLEPGNLCSTQIAIVKPEEESCEWVEIYPRHNFVLRGEGKNLGIGVEVKN